jgi:hypothetical protein
LELRDINLYLLGSETRPALYLQDVQGASLRHVVAQRAGAAPLLVLRAVQDLTVLDSAPLKDQAAKTVKRQTQ